MAAWSTSVRSLGLRTDLMFVAWGGRLDQLGDALRGYTPDNPDYYYGNFLLFRDAPGRGDTARWIGRFEQAFAHDPGIRHVCLRWDRTDGEGGALDELEAAGFVIDRGDVLTARAVRPPPRPNRDVVVREVVGDAEWAAVERLQVSTAVASYGPHSEPWARKMVAQRRRLVESGRGRWVGAFASGEENAPLAGDLGVFVEDGVGRFQAVETEPASRRRGVCGTLVHRAAEIAFAELGARVLVMVAEPDNHAARIYESVGFAAVEKLVAAYRPPG